jgi:putative ABC transport system substrate-binding protein
MALFTGAMFTAPLVVEGQQTGKVYRIGVLEVIAESSNGTNLAALRNGLRERGYVEAQSFTIEYRSADGKGERFLILPVSWCASRST